MKIKKRSATQTTAIDVGEKFPGAPLGDNPRHQIANAATEYLRNYDRRTGIESK